ncbi:MAG: glycosyltransferase family 39 protein [Planctomycetes bacterium]|nr:glycosyltransferase family 39 protein [Planctomycetota bacterium]
MSEDDVKPSEPQPSGRRREWTAVLLVVLALFVLRLVAGGPFSGPWYEPDESTYALRAYHLAHGDGLSWRHPQRWSGAAGAPIVMALPWLIAGDNTDLFVHLTYGLNSLLVCGIVVIGYATFRRWFGHWPSLVGALAMALYGPVFIYAYSFLGEPSFFFLFVLTIWIAQRIADSGRWFWWLALGLAAAASQVSRITGFAFVAAAVVVAVIHLIQQRNRAAVGHLACLLVGLAVVIWPVAVYNRPKVEPPPKVGIEVAAKEQGTAPAAEEQAATPDAEKSPVAAAAKKPTVAERRRHFYAYTNSKQENINLIRRLLTDGEAIKAFGTVIIWALNYILLASLVLPTVLAVRFVLLRWRGEPPSGGGRRRLDPGIVYTVLACAFTVGGIVMRLGMSQMATLESMYGRYLDMVVMLCIGLGVAYLADGLVAGESLFSFGRQQSAREVRRARKRGLSPGQPGAKGAYVVLFVVSFILTVIAVVTLPKINIIFSANLGVNYAAQIGSRLAGYLHYSAGRGAGLIAVLLTPIMAGLCILAYKTPRAAGIALTLLMVVSSAISYQQTLVFMKKNRAQDFHDFARESTDVLDKHFQAHPDLQRAVVVHVPKLDHLSKDEKQQTYRMVTNSLWSLEFYNRDVQFVWLSKKTTLYPETPIYSMWPWPLEPLLKKGNLTIYRGLKSHKTPPQNAPGGGGGG